MSGLLRRKAGQAKDMAAQGNRLVLERLEERILLSGSPAPLGIDLTRGSDTGVSSTDDLTRLDNSNAENTLDFVVSGTVAGATVRLYADRTVIGTAEAADSSTTVTTDGDHDLAEGEQAITARQEEPGKSPSDPSPALNITVDTMPSRPGLELAELTPADDRIMAEFGASVAVSGGAAIIGAHIDDENGGAAYVFEDTGSGWSQVAKLTAEDGAMHFGEAVAISGDTALVGTFWAQAAYVFEDTEVGWRQVAKLTAGGGKFGQSVAISGDTAIVGAPWDTENGGLSGAAYIFEQTESGWEQKVKLAPDDGEKNDRFGQSVSMAGGEVIVGAPRDRYDGVWSGSAYVFAETGSSWSQVAKLVPEDGDDGLDRFGSSVSIHAGAAIVGAKWDDPNGSGSGSAYFFEDTDSGWSQVATVVADDGGTYQHFGESVSMGSGTAVVGVAEDDVNGQESGSAYVFGKSGTGWNQTAKLIPADNKEDDRFGHSVAISDGTLFIGAIGDDYFDGSAYVYSGAYLDLRSASDTGISQSDNRTHDTTPEFHVDAAPYFRLYRDGDQISGDYETGETYTLPEQTAGTHNYIVRAVDGAGNVSPDRSALSVAIDTTLPTVGIGEVSADPRATAVDQVTFGFSETVTGFDVSDLHLTRDGGSNLLVGSETLTTVDGVRWTLEGLGALTGREGVYTLTVQASESGITDVAGNALAGSASDIWTVDTTPPIADVLDMTPNPRTSPVEEIEILFGEPIEGLDISDLTLTRNWGPNLLTGSETLSSTDDTCWTLGGLTGVTGLEGRYVLTVLALESNITDMTGNPLADDAFGVWTRTTEDTPRAGVVEVSPDPRNSAVDQLVIAFSESISGFDVSDLNLSRDGGPNLLTGSETLSSEDGIRWSIGGLADLTAAEGNYELTLVSSGTGITDADGNPLAGGASDAWTVDTTAPVVISRLPAVTSTVSSPDRSVDITFSEPVRGIDATDLELGGTAAGEASVGSPTNVESNRWQFPVAGLRDGSLELTLAPGAGDIEDEAGNSLAPEAWNHTVSILDHFAWDPVSSPQDKDQPFGVAVTAKDSLGNTVQTFSDSVGLEGLVASAAPTPVVITECGLGERDFIEIQNVSGESLDTSGWVVALSDAYGFEAIDVANSTVWSLPESMGPGDLQYRTDAPDDNYWGQNIHWHPDHDSWAMIVDENGGIVDFLAWGWEEPKIQYMHPTVNGHRVSVGSEWGGDGIAPSGAGTIQRQGAGDTNVSSDFAWVSSASKGSQNAGLTVPFDTEAMDVSIDPTVTGSFENGTWAGSISVFEEAEGMELTVEDGIGHSGRSNPFDVFGPPSPAPTAVDLADVSDTGVSSNDDLTRLDNGDSASTLKFDVSGTVAGAIVTLYADGTVIGSATAVGTTTTITTNGLQKLADGARTFAARQEEPGKSPSEPGPLLEVTVDLSAPNVPSAPDLQPGSDTGISDSDDLTRDSTPTFDIDASPYWRVYRDGTQVSEDYETGISYALPTQSDGTYEYTVSGIDAAGNESSDSDALTVTVDTALTADVVDVSPAPRNATVAQVTIDFGEAVSGVDLSDLTLTHDGGSNLLTGTENLSSPEGDRWTLGDLTLLTEPEGTYEFTVLASGAGITDEAGNLLVADASDAWTMDTSAPAVILRNPGGGATVGSSAISVDVTFSEEVSGVDASDIELNGAAAAGASVGSPADQGGDTWRFPFSGLSDGPLEVTLAPAPNDIEDAAGNDLAADTWSYTVSILDHFQWDAIPSPQTEGEAFEVTIRAKNSLGETVQEFEDSVDLSGWIGWGTSSSIVITEVNPDGTDAIEFQNVSGKDVDISGWDVLAFGGEAWAGPEETFTFFAGTKVGAGDVFTFSGSDIWVWVEPELAVILRDEEGNIVDFMCANDFRPSNIPYPSIPPDQWEGWAVPGHDVGYDTYQRVGGTDHNDNSDWISRRESLGSQNADLSVPFDDAIEVAVEPTVSASFVDGVWSGNVLVLDDAEGMHLMANDGNGHTGHSNVFDVLAPRSPAPTAVDLSDESDTGIWSTDDLTNLDNSNAAGALGFTVTGTVAGATVTLYADEMVIGSATATSGTTLITTNGAEALSEGPRVITARQQEPERRMSGRAPALDVTVDAAAPATPPMPDLQAGSDSGRSDADDLTRDLTPTFGVDAAPYFRLYRDGGKASGDYEAGSTYTVFSQPEGEHDYTVAAVDAAGNESASSEPLAVTIDATAPTAAPGAVSPDPRNTALTELIVDFSEAVDGVDVSDLSLTRDGGPNLLSGSESFSTEDQIQWTLGDLSGLTGTEGSYAFTVAASGSGIADGAGNPLTQDASDAWVLDTTVPTADVIDVTPDPRTTPVEQVEISFDEKVTGFDISDLSLTRNGGPNLLTGSETLSSPDGTRWTLEDISGLTGAEGNYTLTLMSSESGIADEAGNPLAEGAFDAWERADTTPPTADIAEVLPFPRTVGLRRIRIAFSEPVTGFNVPDLTLTRDGGPNLLTGSETLTSPDSVEWLLDGLADLTRPEGNYVLTMAAGESGIQDEAGNLLSIDATSEWVTDHSGPWNGMGTFTTGGEVQSGFTEAVGTADLDADGDIDVVNTRYVMENDGSGNLSPVQFLPFETDGLDVGDLNGDGHPDFIIVGRTRFEPFPAQVFLNDGTGGFRREWQEVGVGEFRQVALGDVDADGDLDAFAANVDSQAAAQLWLNDGTGRFSDSGLSFPVGWSHDAVLRDMTGDGAVDILVSGSEACGDLWVNDGQGTFTATGQSLPSSWSVAVEDMDLDGDLDAFFGGRLFTNDGAGNLTGGPTVSARSHVASAGPADFNADGLPDVYVGGSFDEPNRVWLNDGAGGFVESGRELGAASTRSLAVADFNADGALDVYSGNMEPDRVWLNHMPPSGLEYLAATTEDLSTENLHAFLAGNHGELGGADTLNISSVDPTGATGHITFEDASDTLIYDPNAQFEHLAEGESTADSFLYTISNDSGESETGTVTVAVGGVNDTPTVSGRTPAPDSTITTSAVDVDVSFSETVQGVDASDLVLSGTAAAGADVGTPVELDGNVWRFPVTGLIGGTLELSLAPDSDGIESVDGTDLANVTWTYEVDRETVLVDPCVVEQDEVPGIVTGESFELEVHFTDVRDPADPQAVFSGYADIAFDPDVLRVDGIVHDEDFQNGTTGTIDNGAGLVEEVGGTDGMEPVADMRVFTLQMTAVGAGPAQITANPAESDLSQIVAFGIDEDLRQQATYGTAPVQVDAMELILDVRDAEGNALPDGETIQKGKEFRIYGLAKDLRTTGEEKGVFSAYADIEYDTSLIDVTGITHLDEFGNSTSGTIDEAAGLVDELGGTDGLSQPEDRDAQPVFYLTANAIGAGTLHMESKGPEGGGNYVYGLEMDVTDGTRWGSLDEEIVELSDLVPVETTVDPRHVLDGEANLTYRIENQGSGPAGAFEADVVLSRDGVIGNADDLVITTLELDGLGAGEVATGTVALDLDKAKLNDWAQSDDPPGMGGGHRSGSSEWVGLVVDPAKTVEETNEQNNVNQQRGVGKDHITYFPWDIDDSEMVTPTDAIFVINRLGHFGPDLDGRADLDGSGTVTPTDAIAVINRLGYEMNPAVVEVEPAVASTSEVLSEPNAAISRVPVTTAGDDTETAHRVEVEFQMREESRMGRVEVGSVSPVPADEMTAKAGWMSVFTRDDFLGLGMWSPAGEGADEGAEEL